MAITFEREDRNISSEEVRYWKRIIKSNLKIGVEVEFEVRGSRQTLRNDIRDQMGESGSVSHFGRSGIEDITTDGSLRNGLEVKFVGRRVDFLDLYAGYKCFYNIIGHQGYIAETCGFHNHVLLDYGSNYNSMEKDMPECIMINFMQLLRMHVPELVWMTSTIDEGGSITRYSYFCPHDTLHRFTPVSRPFVEYRRKIMTGGRYKFINLNPMSMNDDDIETMHFELRFPDGSIYPAQMAAQNVLYAAMLLKAVELSEVGVIRIGNVEEWQQTKSLADAIRNTNSRVSSRLSAPPTNSQIDLIKERGEGFLKFLKPNLDMYDKSVYRVLEALNNQPISIMRRDMIDSNIVDSYDAMIKGMYLKDTTEYKSIIKTIISQEVVGCYNENNWADKASSSLAYKHGELKNKIYELNNIKPLKFDKVLGTFVFL